MKLVTLCLLIIFVTPSLATARTILDFDGDGRADYAVVQRRNADDNTFLLDWYITSSASLETRHWQWGVSNVDGPTPADYDGDGKTDIAIWRFADGPDQFTFYILNSSDGTVRVERFGIAGDNVVTVMGDYDGDQKSDLVVFRKSNVGGQHYFIYRGSLNNPTGALTYVPWGSGNGIEPYRGDFDGDGKFDFCVRTNGVFILRRSSDGGVEYIRWGLAGDMYFPGDYDGDGRTDFCVSRNTGSGNYQYYIRERDGGGTGASPILWGDPQDMDAQLSAADYDGDGRDDIGIHKGIAGLFWIRRSSDGTAIIQPSVNGNSIRLE